MRLLQNKLLKVANKLISETTNNNITVENKDFPPRLYKTSYAKAKPGTEQSGNVIVDCMVNEHFSRLQLTKKEKHGCTKRNVTKDEADGLQWLIRKTNNGELAVVQADKGGAILIVYPELLRKKVLEKLNDVSLYTK